MPRVQELRTTFDGRLCIIIDAPTDDAGSVSIYTEAELDAVLRSARSSALEEAARIAAGFPAHSHGALLSKPSDTAAQVSFEIAAAIRALKDKTA